MTPLEQVIQATDIPMIVDDLVTQLRTVGVVPGMTLAVHSSLRSLGYVVGGAPAVVLALETVVGAAGTIAMPAHSCDLSDPADWNDPAVPPAWHQSIRQNLPAYDAGLTTTRAMGAVAECFRAQRGALRSAHPLCSWSARGARASSIVEGHALGMSQGETSPLARLYDLDATVLLLGVGYANNTCFHLAEYRCRFAAAKACRRGAPISVDGRSRWVEFEDIYWHDEDFPEIGRLLEQQTRAVKVGRVGLAEVRLFPVRPCVDFAVAWMDANRSLG